MHSRWPDRCRGAAEAKVDATGIQGFQGAELLGDLQWCVVRQHDAAGADTNALSAARQIPHDDRSGRAGDAGHVVVLCDPVALVAKRFTMPCHRLSVV